MKADRHPDPADTATDNEEAARQSARVTSLRPEGPAATGECLHCGEELGPAMRWCNASHRDAWEREQRKR